MTTAELISRLQSADPDGEMEVRFAYQESWPLQSNVRGVVAGSELPAYDENGDPEDEGGTEGKYDEIVFIAEAGQVYDDPYAPAGVFDAAW